MFNCISRNSYFTVALLCFLINITESDINPYQINFSLVQPTSSFKPDPIDRQITAYWLHPVV